MLAYAVCVSIAAMRAVSISLSVFRVPHPIAIFLVEKSPFFAFAAHLCEMCKTSPGGKPFSAQPKPHCHQTVANNANGSFFRHLTPK